MRPTISFALIAFGAVLAALTITNARAEEPSKDDLCNGDAQVAGVYALAASVGQEKDFEDTLNKELTGTPYAERAKAAMADAKRGMKAGKAPEVIATEVFNACMKRVSL